MMKKNRQQHGFAMLFTVLLVSIILSIAIGISNVTFKQNLLSSIAKDSQVAFFAADTGIECALYNEFIGQSGTPRGPGYHPRGALPSNVSPSMPIACSNMTFAIDLSQSSTSYFVYKETVSDGTKPCRVIIFDKTDPTINKVRVRGYSMCNNTPRQVERALEVRYSF